MQLQSHVNFKAMSIHPCICNMSALQALLPLQVQDGQPGQVQQPSVLHRCLRVSSLHAKRHLQELLDDGPFSKQPSHCIYALLAEVGIGVKLRGVTTVPYDLM